MTNGFSTPEECFQYLFCVMRDLHPDIHLLPKPAQSLRLTFITLLKVGFVIGMFAFPWVLYFIAQQHQDIILNFAIGFSVLWAFVVPLCIIVQHKKKSSLHNMQRGIVFDPTSETYKSPRHGWTIKRSADLTLVQAIAHERIEEGLSWTTYRYQLVYLRDQGLCYPVHLWLPAVDSVDLDQPLRALCASSNLSYERVELDVQGLISERDRTETLGRLFAHS